MFTKADIEKYFIAEKQESLVFIVVGVIALLLAIAFFFFLNSIVIPYEEQNVRAAFGERFREYTQRVRRWA